MIDYLRHWEKTYRSLLTEMNSAWGTGQSEEEFDRRFESFGKITYPEFKGHIVDNRFLLSLSDSSLQVISNRPSTYSGGGGHEYIRITFFANHDHDFCLVHEGIYDRIRKTLRMDWEFQTGNDEFDRRYFLDVTEPRSKQLLSERAFQTTIVAAEPFSVIQVTPNYVTHSTEVKTDDELDIVRISSSLSRCIDIKRALENR